MNAQAFIDTCIGWTDAQQVSDSKHFGMFIIPSVEGGLPSKRDVKSELPMPDEKLEEVSRCWHLEGLRLFKPQAPCRLAYGRFCLGFSLPTPVSGLELPPLAGSRGLLRPAKFDTAARTCGVWSCAKPHQGRADAPSGTCQTKTTEAPPARARQMSSPRNATAATAEESTPWASSSCASILQPRMAASAHTTSAGTNWVTRNASTCRKDYVLAHTLSVQTDAYRTCLGARARMNLQPQRPAASSWCRLPWRTRPRAERLCSRSALAAGALLLVPCVSIP